jgi:hypothetical protein
MNGKNENYDNEFFYVKIILICLFQTIKYMSINQFLK